MYSKLPPPPYTSSYLSSPLFDSPTQIGATGRTSAASPQLSTPVPAGNRLQCLRHPSEIVNRVNADPKAVQHVSCLECLVAQNNSAQVGSDIRTIPAFLDVAGQFYLHTRPKAASTIKPPAELTKLFPKESEQVEKLKKHVAEEKKKIETEFERISRDVNKLIHDKKEEYLFNLDQQVVNLRYWYTYVARQIRKAYPSADDLKLLYPNPEEITKKMEVINNTYDLTTFIRSIKEDIEDYKAEQKRPQTGESIKYRLSELVKGLEAVIDAKPVYKVGGFDGIEFIENLNKKFSEVMNTRFVLKTPICDVMKDQSSFDGKILKLEEYKSLHKTLPQKYQNMKARLLYRGTRDGMNAATFHGKCDNKGPTLTVIKCKAFDSSKVEVIGGFLDKSWNSNNVWIQSEEAFLFSEAGKARYPLIKDEGARSKAAQGTAHYGPAFGAGHDLCLTADFSQILMTPTTYELSEKIVSQPTQSQFFNFQPNAYKPDEVEVYVYE